MYTRGSPFNAPGTTPADESSRMDGSIGGIRDDSKGERSRFRSLQ